MLHKASLGRWLKSGCQVQCAGSKETSYSRIYTGQCPQVHHFGQWLWALFCGFNAGSSLLPQGRALKKNVLQISSLGGVVVLPAPVPYNLLYFIFTFKTFQSFQEWLAKACLLLIPRDTTKDVLSFSGLLWEKISIVTEGKKINGKVFLNMTNNLGLARLKREFLLFLFFFFNVSQQRTYSSLNTYIFEQRWFLWQTDTENLMR